MWWFRRLFGIKIPFSSLGRFCDLLAVLLRSGCTVSDAARRATATSDTELRHIVALIAPRIQNGMPLSRALTPYQDRLPALFLPTLEVGEASGTLEQAAQRLAAGLSKQAGFDTEYEYKVFNPWFILSALVLGDVTKEMTTGATPLQIAGDTVQGILQFLVLIIVGRWVLVALYKVQAIAIGVDKVKLALPYLGTIVRNLAMVRWARAFAILWNSGVPVASALEISSRSALNAYYQRALHRAALSSRVGRSLSESLAGTELLPHHILAIIVAGEDSGKLGMVLDQFVDVWEKEALARAQQAFMGISVSLQIFVAVVMFASSAL